MPFMRKYMYALAIGAVLAASAILAAAQNGALAQQVNGTGKKFSESVLPDGSSGKANYTAGGNYTIGKGGFGGNETTLASSGLPYPVDTTTLRMHIDEAKTAMQSNDTQGAMNHMILALEEIESILGGNATMMSNTTSTASNMTSTGNMTSSNSTSTLGPMMP